MSVRSLLLSFLAVLWLWPAAALAQVEPWQNYMDTGVKAYQQGNYPEAEKQFTAAVKEAEGFEPQDPRLATSLNNLAALYRTKGRYAEAEPLYKRALAIAEKALGPDHPLVATILGNLERLYYDEDRHVDARPLVLRAVTYVKSTGLPPVRKGTVFRIGGWSG